MAQDQIFFDGFVSDLAFLFQSSGTAFTMQNTYPLGWTSIGYNSSSDVSGYTFSYWHGEPDDMGLIANLTDMITTFTMPSRDVTLTALYEPLTGLDSFIDEIPKIYPNPFSSNITLKGASSFSMVEVTNILGEKVFVGQTGEGGSMVIHLGYLKPGVYFLNILGADGQVWVEKIVRQ